MEEWQQRLVEEHRDLYTKIQKLQSFMSTEEYANLHQLHKDLLCAQQASMSAYYNILSIRLGLIQENKHV